MLAAVVVQIGEQDLPMLPQMLRWDPTLCCLTHKESDTTIQWALNATLHELEHAADLLCRQNNNTIRKPNYNYSQLQSVLLPLSYPTACFINLKNSTVCANSGADCGSAVIIAAAVLIHSAALHEYDHEYTPTSSIFRQRLLPVSVHGATAA